MKHIRRFVFWCHLVTGLSVGFVVFIMSITGVLLMYQKQISSWADMRGYVVTPPENATRLSTLAILDKVREESTATVSSITLRSGAGTPVEVSFGRERSIFVNPYSGETLGEGAKSVRAFFRSVTDWHRWLALKDAIRDRGKAITGACNLGFLFLVVSGFYLWWPRKWTASAVRPVILFQSRLSGKARDFNWHNVIGVWSALPLFLLVLSATVISYPWASALAFRAFGEKPPVRRGGEGPAAAERSQDRQPTIESEGQEMAASESLKGLDSLVQKAMAQDARWRTITFQVPRSAGKPVTFNIDAGTGGQPQKKSKLTLAWGTGEVEKWETFASGTPGTRMRSILRFTHTGEVAGFAGQTLAGLVSAGAAFLVWTGFALTWRRWRSWIQRRNRDRYGVAMDGELAGADNRT